MIALSFVLISAERRGVDDMASRNPSPNKVDVLIMLGDAGPHFPESLLGDVREAITLDLIEMCLSLPEVGRVLLSTNRLPLLEKARRMPVELFPDERGGEFHFGRGLARVVRAAGSEMVFYIGGGAGPLLSPNDLREMLLALLEGPGRLVTNNLYSSDMAGFAARWLDAIELPARDNDLAWALAEKAKLDVHQPPRSASTSFDVDTITDVVILKHCAGRLHPHTRALVEALDIDIRRLGQALEIVGQPDRRIILIGRASSDVWQALRAKARAQVEVIAEERGMRASGRLARGEVRSLVGFFAEQYGFPALFQALAGAADAVFMDSRVLFAHLKHWPPEADRCYSDLGMPGKIEDEVIRALTQAAMDAPIPVVMGGHSLLSGGMLALLESLEL